MGVVPVVNENDTLAVSVSYDTVPDTHNSLTDISRKSNLVITTRYRP